MKNKVFKIPEIQKYYLLEYEHFDGECFITFNIIDINLTCNELTIAVTNRGRISQQTFDIVPNDGKPYFEYGVMLDRIYLADFVDKE